MRERLGHVGGGEVAHATRADRGAVQAPGTDQGLGGAPHVLGRVTGDVAGRKAGRVASFLFEDLMQGGIENGMSHARMMSRISS